MLSMKGKKKFKSMNRRKIGFHSGALLLVENICAQNIIIQKKMFIGIENKIKYLNLNILRTRCCKPLIFQTQIIGSNRIHSLKYLRSATFGSKDIVIMKSEFVAKTQFLYKNTLIKKRLKEGGRDFESHFIFSLNLCLIKDE